MMKPLSKRYRSATEPCLEQELLTCLRKRAAHISQQQRSLSLKGVRRLLESDLGLPAGCLDDWKAVIADEVETLLAEQVSER